jgi:phosphoglycerol transferase MdoB-like AlkP superfamily enzyme
MTNSSLPSPRTWRASRFGFAAFYFFVLVALWSLLRVVLFAAFRPAGASFLSQALAFTEGFHRDVFAALVEVIPLLLWFLIVPDRWFRARWHRVLFWCASFAAFFTQIFLLFVEYFFFEEFKSRFNTVAVDYLIYPYEVFVNIWQSYPVGILLGVCGALSMVCLLAARKLFAGMWEQPCGFKQRLLAAAAAVAVAAFLTATLTFPSARVGNDRTLNEITNNGPISFCVAFWTRNLDYQAFYKTLPRAEAYQRARHLLSETNSQFVAAGESILRQVSGDPMRPRLNVVIFLEESLGSEFWGCLGATDRLTFAMDKASASAPGVGARGPLMRTNILTPEMDKLANDEGLLFTNLYASGNRTVRGFEGVLSSFPPLPGDSIVRRDRSDNVETIARVLKRDGYSTIFLYGGRGLFDGMRSYAVRNGYDRFVEQKDFDHPTFTTGWGVCDEDLFSRAVEEFRELSKAGKPFCATLLSVSNHEPFTYPKGRIPEDPAWQRREHAVKYSDYALGQFFRAAKKESFWTNTIFVVVADHGARVYGSQSIPIHSYEIPLVILGPAAVKEPARVGALGCSLDVSPTILGMLGRPYQTLFFGRDLLGGNPVNARAFLNHNRDIGMLTLDRLVVLGLNKHVEFYEGEPKKVNMTLLKDPSPADAELERDAIAIYQVADELYMSRSYRIDSAAPAK